MYGARLHKTSRRDAMARDPRRDLLGRDRDILLRDETLVRLETFSRLRRLDRDHIPDNCSFASQKLRYLHAVISAVVIAFVVTLVTCVNKMLLLN